MSSGTVPPGQQAELRSNGGPLFRRPGISHDEFSVAWHRHGLVAVPWFMKSGYWEYTQIHMPSSLPLSSLSAPEPSSTPTSTPAEEEARTAEEILRHADGVALVRWFQSPADEVAGKTYFREVILPDERRFLHDESGAGAVKVVGSELSELPEITVDEWKEMALRMGGVEHIKIKEGKEVVSGAWWDEWEKIEATTKPAISSAN
ncbi:hypothetical protein F5Y16DRAFT_399957 [Xylariaceae sp. FL0255]|nr:hypothetical protein F5Y16DRAFT_399957 [Xylariaceae sp. FL0255]